MPGAVTDEHSPQDPRDEIGARPRFVADDYGTHVHRCSDLNAARPLYLFLHMRSVQTVFFDGGLIVGGELAE
jgi:hypothetical protein